MLSVSDGKEHSWQSERLWPDPIDGPWSLRLTFDILKDRLEVIGVELWAVDPRTVPVSKELPTERDEPQQWERFEYPPLSEVNKPKGAAGITTEGLRVPLRGLLDEWKAAEFAAFDYFERLDYEQLARDGVVVPAGMLLQLLRKREAFANAARRPGRPKEHGRAHYADVARVYKKALKSGKPTAAVSEKFGVSKGAAAKWVAIARNEYKLLPPTSRGKASEPQKRSPRPKKGDAS
jgi:hypothetical protein